MFSKPLFIRSGESLVGTKKQILDSMGTPLPRQASSLSRDWMNEAKAKDKIPSIGKDESCE